RVRQLRAPGERELHRILVRLPRADHPATRPHRHSRRIRRLPPLHLLDDSRLRLLDQLADTPKHLPPPIRTAPISSARGRALSLRRLLGCFASHWVNASL